MTFKQVMEIAVWKQDPAATLRQVEADIRRISREIEVMQTKKARLISKRDKIKDAVQQQKSAELSNRDWDRKDFPWTQELQEKLTSVFGIQKLRAHQLPTMNATLSGIDCILIMPTGGGKSLCYQLPALVSKGVTLVVSPLLALMEDQIMGLQKYNVQAYMCTGKTSAADVKMIHTAMLDPKAPMKLLYVTPEKLAKSKRFMTYLQKMYTAGRFARLAIDEVHCCSQWGHDFRPDYKFLGIMRTQFPKTPIVGLTATATSRVIKDVQKILNIPESLILKASFNRPNLYYQNLKQISIFHDQVSDHSYLVSGDLLPQSGVNYSLELSNDAETLSTDLRKKGVKVRQYHAMMEAEHRTIVHQKWINNELQAVVATIAFGMGIDKPDVRFVIHHCISKSMENFYQESGRAGRDDKPAKCIVYWRLADMFRQSTMVFTEQTGLENLYGMITYCVDQLRNLRTLTFEGSLKLHSLYDATKNIVYTNVRNMDRVVKNVKMHQVGEKQITMFEGQSPNGKRRSGPDLIHFISFIIRQITMKIIMFEEPATFAPYPLIFGNIEESFTFSSMAISRHILPALKKFTISSMTAIFEIRKEILREKDSQAANQLLKSTLWDPAIFPKEVFETLKKKGPDKKTPPTQKITTEDFSIPGQDSVYSKEEKNANNERENKIGSSEQCH
ncbi:unnamed protein product, partial [Meganyctiphanes norvegica]